MRTARVPPVTQAADAMRCPWCSAETVAGLGAKVVFAQAQDVARE